jgi:hypothetical protein
MTRLASLLTEICFGGVEIRFRVKRKLSLINCHMSKLSNDHPYLSPRQHKHILRLPDVKSKSLGVEPLLNLVN